MRITDPAIRRAQISHLIQAAGRPNIELQMLPIAAGVYPVPGESFTCLTFADPAERDIVFLKSAIGDRMLEETDEVNRYLHRFRQLAAAALSPKATQPTPHSHGKRSEAAERFLATVRVRRPAPPGI